MLCGRGDYSCPVWEKQRPAISMEEEVKDWKGVIDLSHVSRQQSMTAPALLTWFHLCWSRLGILPMACAITRFSGMVSTTPPGLHSLPLPSSSPWKEGCATGHMDAKGLLGRGHWCPHFTLLRLWRMMKRDRRLAVALGSKAVLSSVSMIHLSFSASCISHHS